MKAILIALLLTVTLPAVALAQGPGPTPETPYNFEPIEIPDAPFHVPVDIANVDFINDVGSYALTVFTLLDKYNVLGIFVVIMVGLSVLWWLYSFVTDKPVSNYLDLTGAVDAADQLGDAYYDAAFDDAEANLKGADLTMARNQIKAARSSDKERNKKIKGLIRYF